MLKGTRPGNFGRATGKTTAGHGKEGGILPAGHAERTGTATADTGQDAPGKALRRRKPRPKLQKASFYNVKGDLSQRKRPPLGRQKTAFCNAQHNTLDFKSLQNILYKND